MGWANASYLGAVAEHLPEGFVTGKQALRFLRQADALTADARDALRRYSTSEFAGQEDGKVLNAALAADDGVHDEWAEEMDGACVWSFSRDVLLWRGFKDAPALGEPSACFISASLVERTARAFRSRGGIGLSAILLPAGSKVAVPSLVWDEGDDKRTLGVVRREVEIILPRGTILSKEATATPFADRGTAAVQVHVYRAEMPEFAPSIGMAR